MTYWIDILNRAGEYFCEYSLGILIQSSLLIVVLLVIDWLIRKRVRAVVRYCLWMLVLVKLVLPPTLCMPTGIGYWWAPDLITRQTTNKSIEEKLEAMETGETSPDTVTILPERTYFEKPTVIWPDAPVVDRGGEVSPPDPAGNVDMQEAVLAAPTTMDGDAFQGVQPVVQTVGISLDWPAVFMLLWVVGVVILGVLLVQRFLFVRSLIAQSRPAYGNELNDLIICCRQMGIRRPVELRLTANMLSPAACGLWHPVILMPDALLKDLTQDKLRSVLIHELAHIRRGDLWINFAQTLLQIVFFYNPLLWLANGIIRGIREKAVDEMVLTKLGDQAESYSRTLIDIAEIAFSRPHFSLRLVGVVESKSALKDRIRHIVSRPFPRSARIGLIGLMSVCALAVLLIPMAKGEKEFGFWSRGDYRVSLKNGTTVELVGVCKYPGESEQWWGPDGALLGMDIDIQLFSKWTFEEPDYGLVFRKTGDAEFNIFNIKGSSQTMRMLGIQPEELIGYRIPIDGRLNKTNVIIASPTGQWQTAYASSAIEGSSSGKLHGKNIIFAGVVKENDGLIFSCTDEVGYRNATRVIAIDHNGFEHVGIELTNTGIEGIRQRTVRFASLAGGEVDRIAFQTSPYEYHTFKNVALRPKPEESRKALPVPKDGLYENAKGSRNHKIKIGPTRFEVHTVARYDQKGNALIKNPDGTEKQEIDLSTPDYSEKVKWMDIARIYLAPVTARYDVIELRIFDHLTRELLSSETYPGLGYAIKDSVVTVWSMEKKLPESLDIWIRLLHNPDGQERFSLEPAIGSSVRIDGNTVRILDYAPGRYNWANGKRTQHHSEWDSSVTTIALDFDRSGNKNYQICAVGQDGKRVVPDFPHFIRPSNGMQIIEFGIRSDQIDHFEIRPFNGRDRFYFDDVRLPERIGKLAPMADCPPIATFRLVDKKASYLCHEDLYEAVLTVLPGIKVASIQSSALGFGTAYTTKPSEQGHNSVALQLTGAGIKSVSLVARDKAGNKIDLEPNYGHGSAVGSAFCCHYIETGIPVDDIQMIEVYAGEDASPRPVRQIDKLQNTAELQAKVDDSQSSQMEGDRDSHQIISNLFDTKIPDTVTNFKTTGSNPFSDVRIRFDIPVDDLKKVMLQSARFPALDAFQQDDQLADHLKNEPLVKDYPWWIPDELVDKVYSCWQFYQGDYASSMYSNITCGVGKLSDSMARVYIHSFSDMSVKQNPVKNQGVELGGLLCLLHADRSACLEGQAPVIKVTLRNTGKPETPIRPLMVTPSAEGFMLKIQKDDDVDIRVRPKKAPLPEMQLLPDSRVPEIEIPLDKNWYPRQKDIEGEQDLELTPGSYTVQVIAQAHGTLDSHKLVNYQVTSNPVEIDIIPADTIASMAFQHPFLSVTQQDVTAQLLGIRNWRTGEFWAVDGTMTAAPYGYVADWNPAEDPDCEAYDWYEFVVRLERPAYEDLGVIRWDFDHMLHSSSANSKPLLYKQDIHIGTVKLPYGTSETTLNLGLAVRPWQTVASGNHLGFYSAGDDTININYGTQFGLKRVPPGSNGHAILVTYTITDRQFRAIAIGKDGTMHESAFHGSGGTDSMRQTLAYFEELKARDVREYRFQIKPFDRFVFENIPLRPSRVTDKSQKGLAVLCYYAGTNPGHVGSYFLDLATGEQFNATGIYGNLSNARDFEKGDLIYNQGKIACVREAKIEKWENGTLTPAAIWPESLIRNDLKGSVAYYELEQVPAEYVVTTREGRRFHIQVLAADRRIACLEFWPDDTTVRTRDWSESVAKMIDVAGRWLKINRFDDAKLLADRLVELAPENPDTILLKGMCSVNDREELTKLYQLALTRYQASNNRIGEYLAQRLLGNSEQADQLIRHSQQNLASAGFAGLSSEQLEFYIINQSEPNEEVAADSGQNLVVELPDGGTLTLAGVARVSKNSKTWYSPDGRGRVSEKDTRPNYIPQPDGNSYEYRIRLDTPFNKQHKTSQIRWLYEPDPTSIYCLAHNWAEGVDQCDVRLQYPTEIKTANISLQLSNGPWATVGVNPPEPGKEFQEQFGIFSVIVFNTIDESDGGISIELRHPFQRLGHRLVAFDKSGQLRMPGTYRENQPGQVSVRFDGLTLDRVEKFEFQTQALTTVNFAEVALQDGVMTNPKVTLRQTANDPMAGENEISGVVYGPITDDTMDAYFKRLEAAESQDELDQLHASEPPRADRPAVSTLVRLQGQTLTRQTITRQMATNDKGEYHFSDLPMGWYQVSAEQTISGNLTGGNRKAVAQGNAQFNRTTLNRRVLPLHLRDDFVTVRGRVTDAEGNPIAGARVAGQTAPVENNGIGETDEQTRAFAPQNVSAVTNADGIYELSGLEPANVIAALRYLVNGGPGFELGHKFFLDMTVMAGEKNASTRATRRVPLVSQVTLYWARRYLEVANRTSEKPVVEKPDLPYPLPVSHGYRIINIDFILPEPGSSLPKSGESRTVMLPSSIKQALDLTSGRFVEVPMEALSSQEACLAYLKERTSGGVLFDHDGDISQLGFVNMTKISRNTEKQVGIDTMKFASNNTPQDLVVATSQDLRFQLTIIKATDEGCQLEYQLLADEAADPAKVWPEAVPDKSDGPADFEAYFPESEDGAQALETLWNDREKDLRDADEILETVRKGLRGYHGQGNIIGWVGNLFIWGKTPQNEKAIELMLHASDSPDRNLYGDAIYFGLSVTKNKTPAILQAMVAVAMKTEDYSVTGRILWGCDGQKDKLMTCLEPYQNSPDPAVRDKAQDVRDYFNDSKAFMAKREQQRIEILKKDYGDKLDDFKQTLLEGDSLSRKDLLQTFNSKGLMTIIDTSFLDGFQACLTDEDPSVRSQTARLIGGHFVWSAETQNQRVIDMMTELLADPVRQVRTEAVYFGLSTVRNPDKDLVSKLLATILDDREVNYYGRVIWGVKRNKQACIEVLQGWMDRDRYDTAQQAVKAYEIYEDVTEQPLPEQYAQQFTARKSNAHEGLVAMCYSPQKIDMDKETLSQMIIGKLSEAGLLDKVGGLYILEHRDSTAALFTCQTLSDRNAIRTALTKESSFQVAGYIDGLIGPTGSGWLSSLDAFKKAFEANQIALPTQSTLSSSNKPGDPSPKHPDELSGWVWISNGNRAVGAEVSYATRQCTVYVGDKGKLSAGFGSGSHKCIIAITGANGEYNLGKWPNSDFTLIVTHESGWAKLDSSELTGNIDIVLKPWGRIEGVLAPGRMPTEGKIILSEFPNTTWLDHKVDFNYETGRNYNTGRFTFDYLPAGMYEIGYLTATGDFSSSLTCRTPVEVIGGRVSSMTLGGSGRAVVGRFVPPAGFNGTLYFGEGIRTLITASPPEPKPQISQELSVQEQNDLYQQWRRSPEFEQWRRSWQNEKWRQYAFKIEKDGAFRIDDVIPGYYSFYVELKEHLANGQNAKVLGGFYGNITVPADEDESESQPFDTGDLVLVGTNG